MDFDKLFPLLVVLSDDPFLGVGVWDGVRSTERIHHGFACEAKGCFEGVVAVVEAGMDDLRGGIVRGHGYICMVGVYGPRIGMEVRMITSELRLLVS